MIGCEVRPRHGLGHSHLLPLLSNPVFLCLMVDHDMKLGSWRDEAATVSRLPAYHDVYVLASCLMLGGRIAGLL